MVKEVVKSDLDNGQWTIRTIFVLSYFHQTEKRKNARKNKIKKLNKFSSSFYKTCLIYISYLKQKTCHSINV